MSKLEASFPLEDNREEKLKYLKKIAFPFSEGYITKETTSIPLNIHIKNDYHSNIFNECNIKVIQINDKGVSLYLTKYNYESFLYIPINNILIIELGFDSNTPIFKEYFFLDAIKNDYAHLSNINKIKETPNFLYVIMEDIKEMQQKLLESSDLSKKFIDFLKNRSDKPSKIVLKNLENNNYDISNPSDDLLFYLYSFFKKRGLNENISTNRQGKTKLT